MKHTPGPWYVRQDREFYSNHAQPYCISTMPEGEFEEDIWICRCMDNWDVEMQANARLIAAAPEMLEALKELVAEFDQRNIEFCEDHPGTIGLSDTGGVAYARTIISKAEGR